MTTNRGPDAPEGTAQTIVPSGWVPADVCLDSVGVCDPPSVSERGGVDCTNRTRVAYAVRVKSATTRARSASRQSSRYLPPVTCPAFPCGVAYFTVGRAEPMVSTQDDQLPHSKVAPGADSHKVDSVAYGSAGVVSAVPADAVLARQREFASGE